MHVRTDEDTITATPAHPFWVEGTGWVDAGELQAGTALSLADGKHATILSVTREKLSSPCDVYNFEVEGFHTYFVASAGVWVHNSCAGKGETALHHIVAKRAQGAARARKTLERFGIGVDDAENLVRLTANNKVKSRLGSNVHSTLHTKKYYRIVNRSTGRARGREQAQRILARHAAALGRGVHPY